MSPSSHSFQTTRWTHVAQLREGGSEAERDLIINQLCTDYWFPLYGYARRAGKSAEDAEDLTQGFFAYALASDLFAKAQQKRGRLRNFLLGSFRHHLSNDQCRARAAKRGGQEITLSIDALEAEERYRCEPKEITTPEDLYNRRWARDFFVAVKAKLQLEYQAEGKSKIYEALESWLFMEGKAEEYFPKAASIGVTEGNFRVMLVRFRKRYRDLFRAAVADTLEEPTEAEIEQETRELIRLGAR
jgi:DNA-directed RNA polymerase specialized sigma24 family protein